MQYESKLIEEEYENPADFVKNYAYETDEDPDYLPEVYQRGSEEEIDQDLDGEGEVLPKVRISIV